MKVGILAGEASGDILGAGLIQQLRTFQPNLTVSGIGGSAMIEAGCHSLYEMERLSVMGFFEPLKRLPELLKIRRGIIQHFLKNPPDVFVGIDSPDFNLGIELKLKQAGIPIVHYVSPSVWAWRQKRIYKIAKATDLVLTLFPHEADFYRKHDVSVQFVGHPLANMIPLKADVMAARHKLGLDLDATYIAILPGSRRNELHYLAELFIQTARHCLQKNPTLRFITSAIHAERDAEFKKICQQLAPDLPIQFFIQQSHTVMAAANAVLVTSGTATLETMLFKKPMVIAYRVGNITYQIAKRLIKTNFIGLPNILSNQLLVPEFIQDAANPLSMANALLAYINDPEKTQQLAEQFTAMHQALQGDANLEAAKAVYRLAQPV